MDILSTTATTAASTATTTTATTTEQADAVLSSDFETFLQMLTAQAKYQDPLEPIDSSEYAAQLAQFSMVEQQVLSNDLLTSLGGQMGSSSMAQLASWIGMEARTTAPVGFSGAPITIISEPAIVADQAVLIVRDGAGTELQRQQIPTTAQPLQWAGVTDDGVPFPAGQYSFAVESYANGESLGIKAAATYAEVTETRQENGEIRVVLSGGATVSSAEVTALRAPETG